MSPIWIETCNSCDKPIHCYNEDHGSPDEDQCPIDHCENCSKPMHHLDCMAIVDHVPGSQIWCTKCYDAHYEVEYVHFRIGRTPNNLEGGSYQNFTAAMTIGEVIYKLNLSYDIRTRIKADETWLDGNLQEIVEELAPEYPELSETWDDIHNQVVNKLLDIKYPHRGEFMGPYSYSHWFAKVHLQVWGIKFKGEKYQSSVDRGLFVQQLDPTTTMQDLALQIHEGELK